MAEIITTQKLIDADIDVDNLGKAANELGTVNPRYGNPYKTAPQTIQDLQQKADQVVAQGFYQGYTTEALLLAAKPAVAEMRARADDTRKIWRWNRTSAEGVTPVTGSWVDTGLSDKDLAAVDATTKANAAEANAKADATTKADAAKSEAIATAATDATTKANAAEINAKNYTDSSIDNVEADVVGKISTNPANDDLLQLKDANGDDYARFDKDGNLYLANMGRESLQMELKKLPELDDKNSDLINILDADGNLIIRQDADGYLYLPNMKDSIQVAIANRATGEGEFVNSDKIYERLRFSDEVMPYLNHLLISRNTFAAPFYGLLPTNYTVDDSIISNFRADVSPNHVPIDTVYRVDDNVIHPCVVEAVGTIRGYKYIMGITGYENVREENPMVYGSNDLESFEMLTDFVQPLGLPEVTGYLSDIGFCYDPTTGDFICFWRCGFEGRNSLRYRRTKDLINWEEEVEFIPPYDPSIDNLLSPTIVFHPSEKLWYMWTVKAHNGEMLLRKADTLEGLATATYERIINAGAAMPWHIEVKWVGNKFMMLLFNDNNNNLFLGISDDGASWVFSQTPIFTTNPLEFYKSSFVASFNDNGDLELDILYSQGKKVHHSKTNALNINGV